MVISYSRNALERYLIVRSLLALIVLLLLPLAPAQAENVAPGAHWGAIDFPDQDRTVMMGYTVNRFTEFDAKRERFSSINQTAGFNFATVSWTDRRRTICKMDFSIVRPARIPSRSIVRGRAGMSWSADH